MTLSETVEAICSGKPVTDIGQLDSHAKQWLRSEVKAGRVDKFVTHRFPQPNTAYQRRAPSA